MLDERLSASREVLELTIPHSDGAATAWLYAQGEILARKDNEEGADITVALDQADAARFRAKFPYAA